MDWNGDGSQRKTILCSQATARRKAKRTPAAAPDVQIVASSLSAGYAVAILDAIEQPTRQEKDLIKIPVTSKFKRFLGTRRLAAILHITTLVDTGIYTNNLLNRRIGH
jgi:hypothetical protein